MSPQLLQEEQQLLNSADDSAAWKSLLNGSKKALSHIYSRYFEKLYNYGIRISNDPVLMEDCIQDLFIELWSRRAGLNPEVNNVKYYLYTCLRRKIILKLSKRLNSIEISELPSFNIELSHKLHYLNQQMNIELREKLTQIINTLTPKQKEALFLIYFDELSYQEVATIMSLKVKTVYNLVHQAISRLKGHKHALIL